ncbi:hypothetical protein CJD36_011625 [Flavipsychrobacter stenotrophus]|uniref:Uncharacterized protein n=1 Tax=Flavipsychrobacter stenotrophus TaxID=2077091 RepID=A0A2S7SVI4_9BACT|nr:hypothetical protein CJD36_011625 [Flavipsychrobacter stenotrophus]
MYRTLFFIVLFVVWVMLARVVWRRKILRLYEQRDVSASKRICPVRISWFESLTMTFGGVDVQMLALQNKYVRMARVVWRRKILRLYEQRDICATK